MECAEKRNARQATWREEHQTPLDLTKHRELLTAVLEDIATSKPSPGELPTILRRYPLPNGKLLSKAQLLQGYRHLCDERDKEPDVRMVRRLRVKPTRTISGVAPVTVLTKPAPCPGECIFCPDRSEMPKSYLPDEPGAMRAASYAFDPHAQTAGRIQALMETGHSVDKVELLILGGTWSAYPIDYQEWFIRRCLDAMNEIEARTVAEAQRLNETAPHRNVGLVIETRPDCISAESVARLRELGVTKVQLGIQSLNDEILARNRRGHTVDDTRRAMRLLRLGGFKIVAHWMPNLLGATPESDLVDFERLWTDPGLRPDELKIYPTALLAGTTLAQAWQRGEYAPYDEATLVDLLAECKRMIAPTCRLNRLMRDIPTPNILAGVKRTNLRQIVRQAMADHGTRCTCIRCREVRGHEIDAERLVPERLDYETDGTSERFLSRVTPDGRLAGFLRLSLPRARPPVEELTGSAMVREIHIYGPALALGERRDERVQHAGLGSELLDEAVAVARQAGFERLSVIAAVGTRNYYRERGFTLDRLYMSRSI